MGGDFYTEVTSEEEPAMGRSRGDAVQTEETETAKAPLVKQARMAPNGLYLMFSMTFVYDSGISQMTGH